MTEKDKKLLIEFENGEITADNFLNQFSVELKSDNHFIYTEIQTAIESDDPAKLKLVIPLIWISDDISRFLDLLNELLINPNHKSHQRIAKTLQDKLPRPTTVPFVRKVLETNFDYLEYTCSDSDAIAKWFSHLLYSIGTEEAINLMEEYSKSKDEGIASEMQYRLDKIRPDGR